MILDMILELLGNTWFLLFLEVIIMSIMGILIGFHQHAVVNLKKSLADLELALMQEDEKINKNFERIHSDLSMLEKEVNQAFITAQAKHKKQPNPFKPVGKKFKKFLTPKGN